MKQKAVFCMAIDPTYHSKRMTLMIQLSKIMEVSTMRRSKLVRKSAQISAVISGAVVAAAMASDGGLTLAPIRGAVTDAPVNSGHCGRWSEGGLLELQTSGQGWDGKLEYVDGMQGCSNESARLTGNVRRASMGPLKAVNTLWFFASGVQNTPPEPTILNNLGSNNANVEREMSATGSWSRTYSYHPGSGSMGSLGIKGRLEIYARAKVALALNRVGPACLSGACAIGDGKAEFSFDVVGLRALTPDLDRFFAARCVEDGLANWYNPMSDPPPPETLRRRVKLHGEWCRATSISGWQGGVTIWPPSVQCGGSGPDNSGELIMPSAEVEIDRKIPVCVRAPTLAVEDTCAEFVLRIDGDVRANTELHGAAYARVTSTVRVSTLQMRFEEGCVECDPADGTVGPEAQGGSVGAG